MGKLSELANKYGTDKKPSDHNYTPMYEQMLSTINVGKLLEVGLGNGASVQMWRDYFPEAEIYCIEYFGEENEKVWSNADGNIPGVKVINGDSTAFETWEKVPSDLDVIIDDGEHHPDFQINTFLIGFKHLKKGGLYFIEDTHCNFEERYTGGHDIIYKWLFEKIINQQTPHANWGGNFYKAQSYMDEITAQIYSYHLYKSIIAFERA